MAHFSICDWKDISIAHVIIIIKSEVSAFPIIIIFFCGCVSEMFVMPPPLGAGGIMFSGCPSVRPSVRPKPEIPSFDMYMGPLVHPTNRNRFTACPSVRPSVRLSVRVYEWGVKWLLVCVSGG